MAIFGIHKICKQVKSIKSSFCVFIEDNKILITDLDRGMTVTNNIENVIADLKNEIPDLANYAVSYVSTDCTFTRVILDASGNFKKYGDIYSLAVGQTK